MGPTSERERMSAQDVSKILVVGAGVMGRGIAQVVALAGFEVTLFDQSRAAVDAGVEFMGNSLDRSVERGRLTPQARDAALANIRTAASLQEAAGEADHVIEAVIEVLDVKRELFAEIDKLCRDDVVFATNTSQFSITSIASATQRSDRVVGSHWFNPATAMRLIEIVPGEKTSPQTLDLTVELAHRYGKQTVTCRRDTTGFITSRLCLALGMEAVRILEEGIATQEEIDRACRLAFNHAMGPLDTLDYSGLDVTLRSSQSLADSYGEHFRAPQLLRRLVEAGDLGQKSGKGFRDYSANASR